MERLNLQLKDEQNKVLGLQNELKSGSANQRRILEVFKAWGIFQPLN